MNDPDYTVNIQALVDKYNLKAMSFVRMCGVSVSYAYKLMGGEKPGLDICWKIYTGLWQNGYDITFSDVVMIHNGTRDDGKDAR
jgi:predicted transcriptional regulator